MTNKAEGLNNIAHKLLRKRQSIKPTFTHVLRIELKTNIVSPYPKYRRSHIQGLCYVELVKILQ